MRFLVKKPQPRKAYFMKKKSLFLTYLKKNGQNLYFRPRNRQKFTQKWGFTALLMESALILCNSQDKI